MDASISLYFSRLPDDLESEFPSSLMSIGDIFPELWLPRLNRGETNTLFDFMSDLLWFPDDLMVAGYSLLLEFGDLKLITSTVELTFLS